MLRCVFSVLGCDDSLSTCRPVLHPGVLLPPLQPDGLGRQESDRRLYVGELQTGGFTLYEKIK